jgi:hypothetical protein
VNWLLCELLFACVVSAEPMPLEELTYRSALFDWYQDDSQSALVDVLVAREQGHMGDDPLRFDLAQGSFAFEQGMYRFSGETFAAVPAEALTDTDQLRLAFHQSRLHLAEGDFDSLKASLGLLGDAERALDTEPYPESVFMRSELALARSDAAGALGLLEALDDDDPWKAYGLFNTAVTQNESGDTAGALVTLAQLDQVEVTSEETADLKQRGRLAMAWLSGSPSEEAVASKDAAEILEVLPDSSRYRDSALAAYGNLAMSREDYALAARIWLTLKDDDRWLASGAIARIGFPLALHKLQNPDNVLAHYRAAANEFESRLAVLAKVDTRLADQDWIRGLAQAVHRAGSRGPQPVSLPLPPDEVGRQLGNQEWLNWLAAEDVHQVFEAWQSLNDMASWLRSLPRTLEAFAQVSGEQKRRTERLSESLRKEGVMTARAELAAKLDAAKARLVAFDQVQPEPTQKWMTGFATAQERDILEELFALKRAAHQVEGEEGPTLKARIERLIGTRFWEIADDLPARRWALQREVQGIERELTDLDQRLRVVAEAESTYVATVIPRLENFRRRSESLLATINTAMGAREQQIATLLRNRLRDETEQIGQYLFFTRVAIAEVSDQLIAADGLAAGQEEAP